MKALVCGGRNFADRRRMWDVLDAAGAWLGISGIVHGDAPGADRLAGEWADEKCMPQVRFPADWNKYGRAAGPKRNQQMLDEAKPGVVIAFPGGTGTADMIRRAERAGVWVIKP